MTDTIARYNLGFLQWASRNLRGHPRDASIVKAALEKAEGRKSSFRATTADALHASRSRYSLAHVVGGRSCSAQDFPAPSPWVRGAA